MGATAPRCMAFIMDGNGRWAERQGLPRISGHERGADVLREITEYCCEHEFREITFYALSTENYARRPEAEVAQLMELLQRYLIDERSTIMEQNIVFRTIGRVDELPPGIVEEIRKTEAVSRDNTGMILRLALNYGGRQEILDGIAALTRDGATTADLHEDDFRRFLYDPEMQDPDLLVRTAGEYRISNFLLWYLSYSELFVTDRTWPEFGIAALEEALASYEARDRKFGGVRPTASQEDA
ncbi:MAG: polyprenyl diphosphate synthase [Planctomycetota bacterium]